LAALFLRNVDPLISPQHTITPVTPLVGEHYLGEYLVIVFYSSKFSFRPVIQNCGDTGPYEFRIQFAVLYFTRHTGIASRNNRPVIHWCTSYYEIHQIPSLPLMGQGMSGIKS